MLKGHTMRFIRVLAIILAILMTLAISVSCGSDIGSEDETETDPAESFVDAEVDFDLWVDELKDAEENTENKKTPYEAALDNGFDGTAEEWFAVFSNNDEKLINAVISAYGIDEFGNLALIFNDGEEYILTNSDSAGSGSEDIVSPTFIVEKVNAKKGDKRVEVKILVENNPGIASIQFDIGYDKDMVKLVDTAYNTNIIGGISSPYNSEALAERLVWVNGTTDVKGDFVFAKLFFDIMDGAEGSIPICINYDEENVYNIKEENIGFEIINGEITIEK